MNSETQPRSTQPANLAQFLRSIWIDSVAVFSGIISILLLFLGLYLSSNQYKTAVFVLAGLSVLCAGYRVWADERGHFLFLFDSHEQLREQANKTSAALEQAQTTIADHVRSIESLKVENARLSVKPFDEQLKAHTKSVIEALTYMQRDLVRFLLVKGGTARGDVVFLACTNNVGLNLSLLARQVVQSGLVTMTEDHISGYTTYFVNQRLSDALKELLFPRCEGNSLPFFNGL